MGTARAEERDGLGRSRGHRLGSSHRVVHGGSDPVQVEDLAPPVAEHEKPRRRTAPLSVLEEERREPDLQRRIRSRRKSRLHIARIVVERTQRGRPIDAFEQVLQRKAKFAVIFAAGFSEVGAEGEQLEARLEELVASGTTHLLGPNTNLNAFENFRDDLDPTARVELAFTERGPDIDVDHEQVADELLGARQEHSLLVEHE
jgi:hypothetical protein